MNRRAKAALAFLGGFVGGYVACMLVYILATSFGGALDRDGGMAMGVAFIIAPVVAIVCGVTAAVVIIRRSRP